MPSPASVPTAERAATHLSATHPSAAAQAAAGEAAESSPAVHPGPPAVTPSGGSPVWPGGPPGPTGRVTWPLGLPQLRALRRDYLGFVDHLVRTHGDMAAMRIVHERSVELGTPELVRQALVDQAEHLVRWERGVEVFAELFGRSVLTTEGATWQRQRRMLQPAFTPRRVAGYAALMVEAATEVLEGALPAAPVPGGRPAGAEGAEPLIDIEALWSRVTIATILRTLFSLRDASAADAAMAATRVLSATAMRQMFFPVTLPDWLPLPGKAAKRAAMRTLRGLVQGQIDARSAAGAPARDDLLGQLLALRDDDGSPLTPAEVFDQCLVTFQAGHETTATALAWWTALMAAHPEAAARAQAEVDTVLGRRPPEAADAARLPWLVATLKEAMRLYPPTTALMTRRCTRALALGGYTLPAGTLLRVTLWQLQRDARNFEAPDMFRPERFLPDAPPPPRGAYLPFGLGPRVCIGQHFALLEMTLAAALGLQRFVLPDHSDRPLPEPEVHASLRPRGGLAMPWRRRAAATH